MNDYNTMRLILSQINKLIDLISCGLTVAHFNFKLIGVSRKDKNLCNLSRLWEFYCFKFYDTLQLFVHLWLTFHVNFSILENFTKRKYVIRKISTTKNICIRLSEWSFFIIITFEKEFFYGGFFHRFRHLKCYNSRIVKCSNLIYF